MGKKTRRKTKTASSGSSSNEATQSASSKASGPVVLQRIRHADASIRQAALAGILHAQLLHRQSDASAMKLLVAVREQYMGENLDCAVAAAECLCDYLECCDQVDEQLTAGWVALVVDRLKCSSAENENETTKRLSLMSESLQMLALLIEDNPVAMNRLLNNQELREACLERILHWLDVSSTATTLSHRTEEASAVAGSTAKEANQKILALIRTLAARCLESLLQDNAELFEQLFASESVNLFTIFQNLLPLLDSASQSSSSVATLHMAGAFLSAWSICRSGDSDGDDRLESLLLLLESRLDACIGMLTSTLQHAFAQHGDGSAPSLDSLSKAYHAWQADVVDQELDRDVVQKVNARKEPARQIVKRLARQREAKQQQQLQLQGDMDIGVDDHENREEGINSDEKDAAAPAMVHHVNTEEVWFSLLHNYTSQTIRPVSLALELIANLLLPLEAEDGDAVMEDGTRMHAVMQTHVERHALSTHLVDLMNRLRAIQAVEVPLSSPASRRQPPSVKDALDAVASKVGTCLTHALQHLPSLSATMALWSDLYQCLDVHCVSGISHAMVVCLQAMNGRGGDKDAAARIVMDWLSVKRRGNIDDDAQVSDDISDLDAVTRDMICMLGCCLDATTCTNELLSAGASVLATTSTSDDSIAVRAERLNVLIDLFSEDDRHVVFQQTGMLAFFQRELPLLQRQVSLHRGAEDADFFQETAMNTSRFIQYKKSQC